MRSAVVVAVVAVTACSSSEGDPPAGGLPQSCPAASGAIVEHSGDITADEIWAGDGSVHHVTWSVTVRGAALTIAPCAVVRVDPGYGIELAETASSAAFLVARGTAATPIVLEAADPAQPFGTLLSYDASSMMDLAYVTLRGGGSLSDLGYAIMMRGGLDDTVADSVLRVDHVTIEGSEGGGVRLDYSAAFTGDSDMLVVSTSGTTTEDYPISISPIALGSVPRGSYTGNAADAIQVTAPLLYVRRDVTVHERGIAYYFEFDKLRIYDPSGSFVPTLTVEPGVELRFDDYVQVGDTGPTDYPGMLVAVGTATAPIVFTSSQPARAAGDWPGIWLEYAAGSRLEQVRIEYAGGDNYSTSNNCRPTNSSDDAALLLGWEGDRYVPAASDFANVTIADSASHGINAMWTTASFGPDVTAGFTFTAVSGCRQTKNGTTSGCQGSEGCLVP